MAITNKIGAPVTGDDFFGREQELVNAHRYLDGRQSLLLSAPRRIGKSSLAKRLFMIKYRRAGSVSISIFRELRQRRLFYEN